MGGFSKILTDRQTDRQTDRDRSAFFYIVSLMDYNTREER